MKEGEDGQDKRSSKSDHPFPPCTLTDLNNETLLHTEEGKSEIFVDYILRQITSLEVIFLINIKELIVHLGNSIHSKSSFRVKSCMIHLYSGIPPTVSGSVGPSYVPALRIHWGSRSCSCSGTFF